MVLPIGHIGGGEETPVTHVEVGGAIFIVACEEIDPVVVYKGRWIGAVEGLDDGVVCFGWTCRVED